MEPIIDRVYAALQARGHKVTLEYPGFIRIELSPRRVLGALLPRALATGTANPTWTVDLEALNARGEWEAHAVADTEIETSEPDVERIVDALEIVIRAEQTV